MSVLVDEEEQAIELLWECQFCGHEDVCPEWGLAPRPSRRWLAICPACRGAA